MNNISFKSRIRPVGNWEFQGLTSGFAKKQYVNYPWTVKESVLSEKAITKNVYDCTVCGITDGLKVLMLHICPTKKENEKFSNIINFIKTHIDLKKTNLQGFLFGSRKDTPDNKSERIFKNFETFMKENNIPYSKIKGSSTFSDVAYSSETDEWLIKHEKMGSAEAIANCKKPINFFTTYFDDVKISDLDEVDW